MRFVQLSCPEGVCYVDLADVSAIGPTAREAVGERTVALRALYLHGGQLLVIYDTAENLHTLFETTDMVAS